MRAAFSAVGLSILFEAKLDEHILGRQRRQACRLVYVYRADKDPVLELDEILKSDDAHDQYLEWEDDGERDSSDDDEVAPQDWSEVLLGDISDDDGEPKQILTAASTQGESRAIKDGGTHLQDTSVYDPLGLEEGDLSARVSHQSSILGETESFSGTAHVPPPASVSSASELNSVGSSGKNKGRLKLLSSKLKVRLGSKTQKVKVEESSLHYTSKTTETLQFIPPNSPSLNRLKRENGESMLQSQSLSESHLSRKFVSRAQTQAYLDLTSESFDPGVFLWNVHYNQSLDRLRFGKLCWRYKGVI